MRIRKRRRPAQLTGNSVKLLHDGSAAFPAMLEAIRRARFEVLLEMYWFGSDRTGRTFAAALIERAQAGVAVKVIYDAVGSIEASDDMFDDLRKAGVMVHEYNPIAPWRERFEFSRIGRRNHRKVLIVDGRLAITGGINLADQWAPVDQGGQNFRDDAVEIVGPAARVLRRLFYRNFPSAMFPPPPVDVPTGPCGVTVLAKELGQRHRDIYDNYVHAIRRATSDVTIINSYFIPPRRVRIAMAKAAARGVRVRVVVPAESDVLVTQLAGRALYEKMLSHGIEVYEWTGGVLHAKTAVVDDHWSTVGTFNFDALSIHYNLEVNVAIESKEINAALRARIEQDLAQSVAIDLETFRKRSVLQKGVEKLCHAFRWML